MTGQRDWISPPGPPLVATVLGLVLLILASAHPARAQGSSYRRGLKEIESGRWREAATLLREAITDNEKERARLVGRSYLPHYYLGVTLFELRDCQGALSAFAESLAQGVVKGTKVIADLESRQELCQARRRAQRHFDQARDLAASFARLRHESLDHPEIWQAGSPSLTDREQQALAKLGRAGSQLASPAAWQSHPPIDQARSTAASAVTELQAVLAEATRTKSRIDQAIVSKRDELLALMNKAKDRLVARKVDRPTAEFTAARRELLRLIGAVDASDRSSVAALESLIERFRRSLSRFERASATPRSKPPPVPAGLLQAAEHYFSAAYEDVLGTLNGVSFDDDQATAHALLFRAAARFSLFMLTGEKDRELLEQASADIGDLKQIDPSLAPLDTAFSPRFIHFFEQPETLLPGVAADLPPATLQPDDLGGSPPQSP